MTEGNYKIKTRSPIFASSLQNTGTVETVPGRV